MDLKRFVIATLMSLLLLTSVIGCTPAATPASSTPGTGNGGVDVAPSPATEMMTDTEMMTGTDMMTDTEMMTDTNMMTDTDMMTDTTGTPDPNMSATATP